MTDVKSDSGGETKFNVRASTEFIGATQALVSLTPTKSGTAAFLAVADTETIPSATAAEALLAYRKIDFSGTSAQIIQFALSISATQDATSGEVSGGTAAVLQPSTAYKVVMYSSGSSSTLLTFTTFASVDTGNPVPVGGVHFIFDMSVHNFQTGTDGRFQIPFVFSWLVSSDLFSEISNRQGDKSNLYDSVGTVDISGIHTLSSNYIGLANILGNAARGAIFLHTPRSNAIRKYRMAITNGVGDTLSIVYN
ncbi:hypothetical protein P0082_08420 [Candidatus Haliotispira prima]|uniref:Uncharacterized protein n=1 Tax=Candidatus Haliotispira prima TaxID=3034016 RepID=A0ABY8MEU4_9SPIO|nr:hypothetical protein P0082_08420 [Candidatus Haliotispira prima]